MGAAKRRGLFHLGILLLGSLWWTPCGAQGKASFIRNDRSDLGGLSYFNHGVVPTGVRDI